MSSICRQMQTVAQLHKTHHCLIITACEHTESMPPEALKNSHEAESPGCRSFPCLNKSKKVKNATDVVFAKTTLFVIMESEAVNLACLGDKRPFHSAEAKGALIQTQTKFPSIPCRVRFD